jgi:hypothetical protein
MEQNGVERSRSRLRFYRVGGTSLGSPRLLAQLRQIKKMLPGIYMKFTLMTPKTGDAELLSISPSPQFPENLGVNCRKAIGK